MWLKKLWLKLKYYWTKRSIASETGLSQRQKNVMLLERLNPDQFSLYHFDHGVGVFFQTPYATIDKYAEKLKEASQIVRREKVISPGWVESNLSRVSVDGFLTSTEGFYLDNALAVKRFRDYALELCVAMEPADEAEYGVYEHNERMLTKLMNNIQLTTEALIEVSLMN